MKGKMSSHSPETVMVQLVEMKTEMPASTTSGPSSSAAQPRRNLPCGDLLGNRGDYLNIGIPLYEASVKGDWETANNIFTTKRELVRYTITENYDTALHVTASAKSTKFVEKFVKQLVGLMRSENLLLENRSANTAFCLAAAVGNVSIAEILLPKEPVLKDVPGSQFMLPLNIASLYGKYEMVKYLYKISDKMTGVFWTRQKCSMALVRCMEADFFDVALNMVTDQPLISLTPDLAMEVWKTCVAIAFALDIACGMECLHAHGLFTMI